MDSIRLSSDRKSRWCLKRFLMQVLWPAFVGAVLAVGILFSWIDPAGVDAIGVNVGGSREAAYTVGFLILWVLFVIACALSWFLATTEGSPRASNRKPPD